MMAVTKNKVLGIGGAALVAISVALGANHMTKAPAPIPVAHSICENGKTASAVTYQGVVHKKGVPCIAVPDPVKPKAVKRHR